MSSSGGPSGPSTSTPGGSGQASEQQPVAGPSNTALVPADPAAPDVQPMEMIGRPTNAKYGTLGRPVKVLVNFFKVDLRIPSSPLVQYDVRFSKDVRSMVVRRAMMRAMYEQHPAAFPQDTLPLLAYDGQSSLFALRPLKIQSPQAFFIRIMDERPPPAARGDDGEAALKRPRKEDSRPPRIKDELEITLTKVAEVNLADIKAVITPTATSAPVSAPDAFRALDVKLRDYAAQRFLLVKDKFFDRNFGRVAPLPGGIEAWTGFNVSFRPIHNALALNLDVVTACMVQPIPVLDLLGSLLNRNPPDRLSDADRIRLKGILRNLRVEGRPSGQKHKVYDLTREGAADLRFNNRRSNDESQSVAEYYERQHGITLRFPLLPCISASNRPNRPCWVPLELCSVVDAQRYLRQLTPQQVAAIGNLRLKPDKRRVDIANAVGAAGLANNPMLEAFGMRIQPNMIQADGRQLEPPVLQFGNKGSMQPRDGQWNMNDKRMFSPASIASWAVVCFDHRVRDPMQVATALKDCCARKGLVIESRPEVIVEDTWREAPEKLVESGHDFFSGSWKSGRRARSIVGGVGVASCCALLPPHLTSPAPPPRLPLTSPSPPPHGCSALVAKASNDQAPMISTPFHPFLPLSTALYRVKSPFAPHAAPIKKLCDTMRGVNWVLTNRRAMRPLSEMPTMVFGLDVSHGAPGSRAPSIAAVVASMDPDASKYAVRRRAQHRRQETILGLFDSESATGGMLCELMNDFGNANKMGPQRIIVFRDGISESQFPTVGATELQAFRKAFELMGRKVGNPSFRPTITYIVAQKRNNVRFLPSQGDRNVQPGTIVDKDVTHPFFFDFYMVSHKGLLGTSRPVHYHVLHDENGFTADEIQQLTHSLCYNYGRCTRAVSTVAPVFYAHLAATHCRNHFDHDHDHDATDFSSESSAGRNRDPAVPRPPPPPVPELPALAQGMPTRICLLSLSACPHACSTAEFETSQDAAAPLPSPPAPEPPNLAHCIPTCIFFAGFEDV
ncbi:unnamed protein product [Closterium sp. Naga37s-1]|nr:unnamed protein product [Closterium sp. Naga37s-1]